MSWETYDENCDGCRPALLDLKTGKPLPDDSPQMQIIMKFVWSRTSLEERQAWHAFTCQNSRNPRDVAIAQSIARRIQVAINHIPCN